jgi:Transposase domain (DUF772)
LARVRARARFALDGGAGSRQSAPMRWTPPIELSPSETKLCKRLEKHRRFYRFLRLHRRALFDDAMQARLASTYAAEHPGDKPVAPALLGMVTLLQAYAGASDADAVQNAETDLRWQMPLDCDERDKAPFSQAALVHFRTRLIDAGLHAESLHRTVELAKQTKNFGYKNAAQLRIALDFDVLRIAAVNNLLTIGRRVREAEAKRALARGRVIPQQRPCESVL